MRLTIQGALLFLFIPLVLFLYLRQPLGPAVSILIGIAIMFCHRFVAAPWMARHSTERCLWCGRTVRRPEQDSTRVSHEMAQGPAAVSHQVAQGVSSVFHVLASGQDYLMAACAPRHRDYATRFLTFISRWRALIALGIFVPLLVLLIGSLAAAASRPFIPSGWNTWQFRTIVAFTVVVTSLAYRTARRPVEPLRSPFPLHNLYLLGIRNTLWVFRLVGAWWLVAGVWQIVQH